MQWSQANAFTDQRQSPFSPRPALPLGPELLQVRSDAPQGHPPTQPSVAQSHSGLGWPRRTESLLYLYFTYVTAYTLRSLGTGPTSPLSFLDTGKNPQIYSLNGAAQKDFSSDSQGFYYFPFHVIPSATRHNLAGPCRH